MLRRRVLVRGLRTSTLALTGARCTHGVHVVRRQLASSGEDQGIEKPISMRTPVASGSKLKQTNPATGRPYPFPGLKASVHVNLAELYELDEDSLLGRGSFGVVHRATDKRTGQRVAIKALSKAASTWSRELIEKEVNIMLDHPVASRLLDTAEDSGYFYMITELYEGGELFDRLIERGRQSEADVANILRQVLGLLSHCHSMGIVHRDLKPENIIFRHPPDAVGTHATELAVAVVDFGFAEKLAPDQVLTERVGSLHYMAPEVIGRRYTQSAELWAVGVILYVMLCAEMPFNGSNNSAIFSRIRNGSYDMTSVVWEQVSEDAKDLLAALLQKDPNNRPSAAAALQHRWLNGSASADAHPLAPSIVQVLVRRQLAKGLQREALKAVVPLLGADAMGRVAEARRCFHHMDSDNDGLLSLDEFVIGLRKLAPAEFAASRRPMAGSSGSDGDTDVPAVFKVLFSQIDSDGAEEHGNDADGRVDLEEWLAAAVVSQEFSRHHGCAHIFAKLDTNSDGRIDAKELADCLESTTGVDSGFRSQRRQLRQTETQEQTRHLRALRGWPEEGMTLEEFTDLLCGNPD